MNVLLSAFSRFYSHLSQNLLSLPALAVAVNKMSQQEEQLSKCVQLCQEHFGGAWNQIIEPQAIESSVKPLSGGLSNFLYIAKLPHGVQPEAGEPSTVLLRFYGVAQGNHDAILKDSLVFALLAERGIGPKLYGCFAGGRFEEYIPARCLKTAELSYPQNMSKIATQMATFHLLDMPLCKEPTFIKKTTVGYVKEILKNMDVVVSRDPAIWKDFLELGIDLVNETQWLMDVLYSSTSSVRFCHNDVQEGNILKGSEGNDDLVLIDFEYSAYNFRGYDVANHFLEWCQCYDVSEPPFFKQDYSAYPTIEQQRYFFHHYLTACGITPTEEEKDMLYLETQLFQLGCHFLWGTWSFVSALTSQIEFGYMLWGYNRLKSYKEQKEYLQTTHPELLKITQHCDINL